MNERALYYPYIHIQNVNWLKATLLLFYQVRRMVPENFAPQDSEEIKAFTSYESDPPLLYPAQLWSPRVIEAQDELAQRLNKDAEDASFRLKYGQEETSREFGFGLGFQIHMGKLSDPLKRALCDHYLAWNPAVPESYDLNAEYVEIHPRLGEAVMSTLAVAAATAEGLDVVGDGRSGKLHACLLERNQQEVYDAWIHKGTKANQPPKPKSEEIFEYFVGFQCDLTDLTATSLASLRQDREPLRKLLTELRKHGSRIPAMDPGKERDNYFKEVASDVLGKWRADRKNMSSYARRFFGEGLLDPGQKFLEKATEMIWKGGEKAATGAATGATGAAMSGGGLGTVATCAIAGAASGLAIGIASHGVKTYFRTAKAERESPYHYLTLMEKAGVVFRTEI